MEIQLVTSGKSLYHLGVDTGKNLDLFHEALGVHIYRKAVEFGIVTDDEKSHWADLHD
jgi:hypothetical protein